MVFKLSGKARYRRIAVVAAATLLSSVVIACSSSETPSSASTLTVGLQSGLTTLDPYNYADEVNNGTVDKLVFEGLINVVSGSNGSLEYKPLLATSWTHTAPLVWRFELRTGVKFQDGSDFTADDVKFTLDRYSNKNARAGNSWAMEWYKSVAVKDLKTVDITTAYPVANIATWVSYIPKIVSATAITKANQVDAQTLSGAALVGTGPYSIALDTLVPSQKVTLNINKSYWGTKPEIPAISFQVIADDSARINALKTGQIQLATSVPPALASDLGKAAGVVVRTETSSRYDYMWLNTLKPPFDNPLVRQAANHAVDMATITKKILNGAAQPANAPLAPQNFGHAPQTPYSFDPELSKKLLKEAGLTLPVKVDFWAPQARYLQDAEVAAAVQNYMNQAGFQVNLQLQEWGSLSSQIFAEQDAYRSNKTVPKYNMLYISWASVTLDADYALYEVFHSGQNYNLAYYKNPKVDQLLDKARLSPDQAPRKDMYAQAEGLIWKDAPQLFGFYEPQIIAQSDKLEGVVTLPYEHVLLQNAHWKS